MKFNKFVSVKPLLVIMAGLLIVITALAVYSLRTTQDSKKIIISKTTDHGQLTASILGQHFAEVLTRMDFIHEHFALLLDNQAGTKLSPVDSNYIRRTLLDVPQLSAFLILNSRAEPIWVFPPTAGIDNVSLVSMVNDQHRLEFKSFNIEFFSDNGTDMIAVSRLSETSADSLLFISIMRADVLLKTAESVNKTVHDIILLDSDFTILSHWNSGLKSAFEVSGLLTHAGGLVGGNRSYIDKKNILSLYQLHAFPYIFLVNANIEDELAAINFQLRRDVFLFGFLLISSITITILIGRISQQRSKLQKEYLANLENTLHKRTQIIRNKNENLQQALREREMILKEIHHRIKNNLAMVSGIVQLYKRQGKKFDESTFNDLIVRIDTISLVHEKLYGSQDFNQVELRDYIEELIEALCSTLSQKNIKRHLQVQPWLVSSRTIVSIGMIVTEITTNAIKYGLQEHGNFYVKGELIEEHYQIHLANDGNHLPENFKFEGHSSLGMQIILNLVQQINAKIEVRRLPMTTFIIHIPVHQSESH